MSFNCGMKWNCVHYCIALLNQAISKPLNEKPNTQFSNCQPCLLIVAIDLRYTFICQVEWFKSNFSVIWNDLWIFFVSLMLHTHAIFYFFLPCKLLILKPCTQGNSKQSKASCWTACREMHTGRLRAKLECFLFVSQVQRANCDYKSSAYTYK